MVEGENSELLRAFGGPLLCQVNMIREVRPALRPPLVERGLARAFPAGGDRDRSEVPRAFVPSVASSSADGGQANAQR